MTARDRIVLMVIGAVAVLAAAWVLVVSSEQKRASEVGSKVEAARSALSAARSKVAEAQQAQRDYAAAYASIVSLGEAVPADREVPSLVYELDHASSKDDVNFESIVAASGSGGGGSSSSSSATASAASALAGFQQLPFTFSFLGSYEQLYKLIGRLQGFTVSNQDGSVRVNGRLLSIEGLTLTRNEAIGSSSSLKATVTATAYVLPPNQTLTSGASPTTPAGAGSTAGSSSGSAVTPAVVRPLR